MLGLVRNLGKMSLNFKLDTNMGILINKIN